MQIRNNTTEALCVNIAVIHPKDVQDVNNAKFFRGYASSRSQDFDLTLTSNEFSCLPINSDIYDILVHHRMMLDPSNGGSKDQSTNGKNYGSWMKWIPLKRQLRYDQAASVAETGNTYVVWWADKFLSAPGTVATNSAYQVDVKLYKYFKETPN